MFEKEGDLSSAIVVDYGLATMVADRAIRTNCGTASFKAPEVLLNKGRVPHLEDVYALGIAFGVYLTANAEDYTELVGRDVNRTTGGVFSPDELRSVLEDHDVCEDAVDLLLKMTEKDPKQRISAVECLNHKYFDGLRSSSGEENTEFNSHWTRRTAMMLVEHRQLQTRNKQLEKENRELTRDVKRLSEFETKIAELEEKNAKLKAELQDRSTKEIDGLETQFAEAGLAASSAASAPGETGLEEGFSALRLQDASSSASVLIKIVLRTEKVINDGDIIPPSTFLEDPVKFGGVFAFEQVFNYYWKERMKTAEDGGEYPDLDAFFSNYASKMTVPEDKLVEKKKGDKNTSNRTYAKRYIELFGADKTNEKKRKNERKEKAQAASKALAVRVQKAKITDNDIFSSVVDKLVVAIDSVFDHSNFVDSFGVVKNSSRRTLATLLAAIHVSAGDEWGNSED